MATHKDREGSVRATVLLEEDLLEEIDELAKKSRLSRAEYIREILIEVAKAQTKITRGPTIFSPPILGINSASSAKSGPENIAGEADKSKVGPPTHEALGNSLDALHQKAKRGSSAR